MEQIQKKGTKGTKPRALPKTQRVGDPSKTKVKAPPLQEPTAQGWARPMEMPTTAHTLGSFIRRLGFGRGDHHPDDK